MDPRTPTRDLLADQLVRVGNGDQTAFAVVYDEVAGCVYGMGLRVLRDADLARDAAADTFAEIWARAGEFQPAHGSALGWVMTLAHRRAVERARSVVVEAGNAHADVPGHAADLTCLPETERRAVELAYFHGTTCAGVADLMQAPLDTTRTRIRAALLRLGEHLRPLGTAGA